MSLEDGEFGGLHDARSDEVQTEILFLVDLLRLNDPADEALNIRNEPYLEQGIGDVEGRVEGCEGHGSLDGEVGLISRHRGIEASDIADQRKERLQQNQAPQDAQDVDCHVGKGCAAGLRVGTQRDDVGRDGGADVLAEHEHDTLVNMEDASRAEHHRDGHDGCRRLHAERENRAHQQEEQGIEERRLVEVLEELTDGDIRIGILNEREACLLECSQSQEEEGHAKEEIANDAALLHIDEDDTDEECRKDKVRDIEAHTERHDPGRDRRTNVGAHND